MTIEQEAALIAARYAYETYELLDSEYGDMLICDYDLSDAPQVGDTLEVYDTQMLVLSVTGLQVSIRYLTD